MRRVLARTGQPPVTGTLLVVAKEPVPGRVKTRLCPPCTPEQAARLAADALADTLATGLRLPVRRRVLVLDGRPGPWLPAGWEVVPQCGGGLDRRLAAAFAAADPGLPALLVGMDTPQLTPALLAPALGPEAWRDRDAWYGPAADGGFWALGLARPDAAAARRLLEGVPMSVPDTGAELLRRLGGEGLRTGLLPQLADVDTAAEAEEVAALAPGTRFAAGWRGLCGAQAADGPAAGPAAAAGRPAVPAGPAGPGSG
ncbi:DUF2064 domain-containing protein [Streptacidiphilus sp. ASG 303]|nr:DUF2064 domain-containing protein [Streptacidiphilus sp. ASG 303]MCD0483297.1 DUF2064 domain-containing protein [Streptacidiphilus sp. ASG 303]